jgi:hypothetical protein
MAKIVDLRVHEDSSDRVVEALASAGVSVVTDTTLAAVGLGAASRTKITVGTPANFTAGRSYALVNVTGEKQEIVVDHVDSTSVYAKSEIRRAFPVGSTLRGVEVSFAFPASEADSETAFNAHAECPYAVDWFFTGGTPATARELIYLRRAPEAVLARPVDVELLSPQIGRLNTRDNKIEKALEQSHRDFWRLVRARGIDTDTRFFGETGRDWVAYRACELLSRALGNERDDEMANEYKRMAAGIFGSLGGFGEAQVGKRSDQSVMDPQDRVRGWSIT